MEYVSYDGLELAKLVRDGDGSDAWSQQWSKRQGVVELFPCLSSPNRTCTSRRIRLSIQEWPMAMATYLASLPCISLIIKGLHLIAVS